MQTKQQNERARQRRQFIPIAQQERSHRAGRRAKADKHDRKSEHECERRSKQFAARSFALLKLVHSDTRKHRDVSRHERQNTRREERDESRQQRRKYGHVHLICLRFSFHRWMSCAPGRLTQYCDFRTPLPKAHARAAFLPKSRKFTSPNPSQSEAELEILARAD